MTAATFTRLFFMAALAGLSLFSTNMAMAAAPPALKIAPLKYQEAIPLGKIKTGFVDVSNPTNERVVLVPEVQGFRQRGSEGELQFYNSEVLKAGIGTDVGEFELGPREAARIKFTIDPNKLPQGGVYAALFFKTSPVRGEMNGNQVLSSARVGTLLILDIGAGGSRNGRIENIKLPFMNLGDGIKGSFSYANTAKGGQPIAFNPKFDLKYGFFSKPTKLDGPLVFPDNSRKIDFSQKGDFIGLIPVTVEDKEGQAPPATIYVLAITGYWRIVFGLVILMVIALGVTLWDSRRK